MLRLRSIIVNKENKSIIIPIVKEIASKKNVHIYYRDYGMHWSDRKHNSRELLVTMDDYNFRVCKDLGVDIENSRYSRKEKRKHFKKLK